MASCLETWAVWCSKTQACSNPSNDQCQARSLACQLWRKTRFKASLCTRTKTWDSNSTILSHKSSTWASKNRRLTSANKTYYCSFSKSRRWTLSLLKARISQSFYRQEASAALGTVASLRMEASGRLWSSEATSRSILARSRARRLLRDFMISTRW